MNPNETIGEQLYNAELAINNGMNVDYILEVLIPFGYDLARLQAAKGLHEAAVTAVAQQAYAYGEQYQATADLRSARREANTAYMQAVKIARVAFQGDVEARASLRLAGTRARGLAGWVAQATVFYQNLLTTPDLLAAMAGYGFDAAKLSAGLALVRDVEAANQRQEAAKGSARAATKARDIELRRLRAWMSDFRVVAPIALADQMQSLEILGLRVVPSD